MRGIDELLGKLPAYVGKMGGEAASNGDIWGGLSTRKQLNLRDYYDIWRKNIRDVARTGVVLSNGWAFSTLSGLASYEAFVSSDDDISILYENRTGEIESTNEAVKNKIKGALSGAIIYGYGNLVREEQYIQQALTTGSMNRRGRVYLIDCSIFYYLFAQSMINPLRRILDEKRIKPVLADSIGDRRFDRRLTDIRSDLNPTSNVLHIFFGNTFCNVEPSVLKSLLDKAVHPGDVVIAEYALYENGFFAALGADHVSEMAKRAAADLFHVPETRVAVDIMQSSATSKVCNIKVWDRFEYRDVAFKSMLRRRYLREELLTGEYELLSNRTIIGGNATLDAYRRLPRHD